LKTKWQLITETKVGPTPQDYMYKAFAEGRKYSGPPFFLLAHYL